MFHIKLSDRRPNVSMFTTDWPPIQTDMLKLADVYAVQLKRYAELLLVRYVRGHNLIEMAKLAVEYK